MTIPRGVATLASLFLLCLSSDLSAADTPPDARQGAFFVEHAIDAFVRSPSSLQAAGVAPGVVLNLVLINARYENARRANVPPAGPIQPLLADDKLDRLTTLADLIEKVANGADLQQNAAAADAVIRTLDKDHAAQLVKLYNDAMRRGRFASRPPTAAPQKSAHSLGGYLETRAREELVRVLESSGDPDYRALIDQYLGPKLGVTTRSSADLVVAANSALAVRTLTGYAQSGLVQDAHTLLSTFSGGPVGDDDIRRIVSSGSHLAKALSGDAAEFLRRFEAVRGAISDADRAFRENALTDQRTKLQQTLGAAEATSHLVTSFLSLADKNGRSAEIFATTTKAVITVADTIGRIGSVGTSIATGNIIGAVFSVVSLFSPAGPSPYQLISEQLDEMRKQIDLLQSTMEERFNQIDRKLNVIYSALVEGLDEIRQSQGRLREAIVVVERKIDAASAVLASLSAQLSHLQVDMNARFKDLSEEARDVALEKCLRYGSQREQPSMPFEIYDDCGAAFTAWATASAYRTSHIGTAHAQLDSREDLDDPEVMGTVTRELRTHLGDRFQILAEIAKLLGNPGLVGAAQGAVLPSISVWKLGAEGYIQMLEAWGTSFPGLTPSDRLQRIHDAGARLRAAVLAITTQTPSGAQVEFLRSIVVHYLQAIARFRAAAEGVEVAYRRDKQIADNLQAFSLWDLSDQVPTVLPRIRTAKNVEFPQMAPINLSDELIRKFTPPYLLIAELLGLGNVVYSWDTALRVSDLHLPNVAAPHVTIMATFVRNERGRQEMPHILDRSTSPDSISFSPIGTSSITLFNMTQFPEVLTSWLRTDRHQQAKSVAAKYVTDNWSDGVKIAEAVLARGRTPSCDQLGYIERSYRSAILEQRSPLVDQILAKYRSELAARIVSEFHATGGSLWRSRVLLQAAERIVKAFVETGFSESIRANDELSSSLYGTKAYWVADDITSLYQRAYREDSVLHDVRIRELETQRSAERDAFLKRIDAGLSGPDCDKAIVDFRKSRPEYLQSSPATRARALLEQQQQGVEALRDTLVGVLQAKGSGDRLFELEVTLNRLETLLAAWTRP